MRRASARGAVPLPPPEVLRLWADVDRWPSFVEGFARRIEVREPWPDPGGRVVWESTPTGRGRVTETVVERAGDRFATQVFEDALAGTQTLRALPASDGSEVELSLEYELAKYGPLRGLADAVFIRRALRDALRRTLARFRIEVEEEALLGQAESAFPADLAPESRAIMHRADELGLLDVEAGSVAEQRRLAKRDRALFAEPPELPAVRDVEIPGPASTLPARVYTPPGEPPFAAIAFFHGGGWVVGDVDHADVDCRCLCLDTGAVVVSVGYRLAPEDPFPAAVDDCFAAVEWVVAEAPALDADPGRVAVCGDSAGGNLAAAVALVARDRGAPAITDQVLIYPVTDCAFDTTSYGAFADGYGMSRDDMRSKWEWYLGEELAAGDDPRASPLRARDLTGLPRAVVVTAGCDVLRDEGNAYARRLTEAGVPVTLLEYPGQVHGFWSCGGVTGLPREVNRRVAAVLAGSP